MNKAKINKYSSSLYVYSAAHGGSQVGTIYYKEHYVTLPEAPLNGSPYPVEFYGEATKIKFRNSSGQIATGYLQHNEGTTYPWIDYQKDLTLYPCFTTVGVEDQNRTLHTDATIGFDIWRDGVPLRNPDGSLWKTVSKLTSDGGTRTFVTNSCQTGSTYNDHMYAKWIKADNGQYYETNSAGYFYVEIGFQYGSGPNDGNFRTGY